MTRYQYSANDPDSPTLKFKRFHGENPEIYENLRTMALDLKSRGHSKYGVMSLLNVIRWHRDMETVSDDFKVNNNFAPYYARLLMRNEPALQDFFRLRTATADFEGFQ